MADQQIIDLGIVGMVHKGEYSSERRYEKLNIVTYNGSSYCAKGETIGNVPTDTDYWDLLSEKGSKGDQGIQGEPGIQGIQGLPGQPGGTPLVASSVSEMSDTSTVYVNTTDGNWYYYDGTNWEIGGVYQATQDAETIDIRNGYDGIVYSTAGEAVRTQVKDLVDKTDLVNETGEFTIPISKWELGYWKTDTLQEQYNNKRMCLSDCPIIFKRPIKFVCDPDTTNGTYQLAYFIVDDDDQVTFDSHWQTSGIIPENVKVYISTRLSPEIKITDIMTLKNFVSHYYFSSYLKNATDDLNNRVTNIEEQIDDLPIESGFSFDHKPIVDGVGHRGIAGYAPANTLIGFKKAKQLGFKSVETDIRWTSDGVPVLCHNRSINSTARNMDGTEIQNTVYVDQHTLAELRQYDFGIAFSEDYRGQTIPTVEEFLILCRNIGLSPWLEIKEAVNVTTENLNTLFNLIDLYNWRSGVRWTCFVQSYLEAVLDRFPKTTVQYTKGDSNFEEAQTILTSLKTNYPNAHIMYATTTTRLNSTIIEWLKSNEIPLAIFTVDDITVIQNMDGYICGVTSNTLNAEQVIYERDMSELS